MKRLKINHGRVAKVMTTRLISDVHGRQLRLQFPRVGQPQENPRSVSLDEHYRNMPVATFQAHCAPVLSQTTGR